MSSFSITIRQRASLRDLIEAIPEEDWTSHSLLAWTPPPMSPRRLTPRLQTTAGRRAGAAHCPAGEAESPGSQLALFASIQPRSRLHAPTFAMADDAGTGEADHRRHAEVENAIRDAQVRRRARTTCRRRASPPTASWLAVQVMAHNRGTVWTAAYWSGASGP